MNIRAVPTTYAGCRFRSRLEAPTDPATRNAYASSVDLGGPVPVGAR